jgi:hypothetical protein
LDTRSSPLGNPLMTDTWERVGPSVRASGGERPERPWLPGFFRLHRLPSTPSCSRRPTAHA